MSSDASTSTDAAYDIFHIPVPPADVHIRNHKRLRLTSLKLDPEAFSSSYEREVNFDDSIWRQRLGNTDRLYIVARVQASNPNRFSDNADTGDETWVGSVMVASLDMLKSLNYPVLQSILDKGSSMYFILGLWIHPQHRKKGQARRLLQAGLDWARTYAKGGTGGQRGKVLGVEVKEGNLAAISLYTSLGFQRMAEGDSPGRLFMALYI
ncbi:hypothetical protein AX17_006672 [Amanita inopinata Kibby_2008]|nr:hypothetical protein AX17_006672 [Amanita inopinata Kibby_2008]